MRGGREGKQNKAETRDRKPAVEVALAGLVLDVL